jgi:uncharacterized protein YdaU (DUF1376 family)
MNAYMTDGYWWSSDNFRADRDMLERAADEIVEAYNEAAQIAVSEYLKRQLSEYQGRRRDFERRLDVISMSVAEREGALAKVCEQRDQRVLAHQQFVARMQQSIEHSQRFEQYIYEAFHAELSRVREAIRSPATALGQVYDLFYLHVLLGELDKMLEGKKF